MKKLKFSLLGILFLMPFCLMAQENRNWNTLYLQLNNLEFQDSGSQNGGSIGYNKAFSLSPKTPLFLESGLGLQYCYDSASLEINEFQSKIKFHLLSLKAPINLVYRISFPNGKIHLLPFAGFTLRGNLIAKAKIKAKVGNMKEEESINLFNDPANSEIEYNQFKRFQIGWNVGLNAEIGKHFVVGLSYGKDFNEIATEVKVATTSLTLGYRF